ILDLTVDEAVAFFGDEGRVGSRLKVLQDVGLGYLTLGQPSNTLSGGEAQRVKLAAHLGKSHQGHTLYLFDEPTTGLHFDDIRKLLDAFNALVEAGHSVVLVEHNLRSEEHTSELQSRENLVCRLLLEKKNCKR